MKSSMIHFREQGRRGGFRGKGREQIGRVNYDRHSRTDKGYVYLVPYKHCIV